MNAKIINGKAYSDEILGGISKELDQLRKLNIFVKLVVVMVGQNDASMIYVRNKVAKAKEIGMLSEVINLDYNVSQAELSECINRLNNDNSVHGIIVQLPLPSNINTQKVLSMISPDKDVDGFHPINVGKLNIGDVSGLFPCTALGILHILERTIDNLDGKHVVVVGRSQIVGKPTATLLLQKNCTVTIAHSHSKNLESITSTADIVVCAIGKSRFFSAKHFKENSVVIDVGMNRIDSDDKKILVGDVNFNEVIDKVSYITPVPNGVGPMTIAFLLSNTLKAMKNSIEKQKTNND